MSHDSPDAQPDLSGTTIASQFKVTRKLGAGGMGAVYLAEQLDMGRHVVIKVMHPELTAGSSQAVERFKREARAVAQLNHPNIVQVYVFGHTDSGQLYQAMEFIDGRTLTDDIKAQGRIPQARALRVMDQVCSALSEAHAVGIVHRDLKPDNIMLTDRHGNPDYVKVLDFGIAKMLGDDGAQAQLTAAGAVFGTPRYMSPEQVGGKHVDARTDIYALGVILYEMLTGAHPFRADSAIEYLMKHSTEPVQLPSHRFGDLHLLPRTEAIVGRCLEKLPADRFQSAADLQREIRKALRDLPDALREFPTPGAPTPTWNPPQGGASPAAPAAKKSGAALWATLALLLAAGGGGAAWYFLMGPGKAAAPVVAQADTSSAEPKTATVDAPKDPPTSRDGADDPPANDPPADPPPANDPPANDPPANDPPPADPPPHAAAAVPAGEPIDGLPVPHQTRMQASASGTLVLQTELKPTEVIAFYRQALQELCGTVSDIPNGLQGGADCKITYVTLSKGPAGLTVSLVKNALLDDEPTPDDAPSAFGAALFPGAKEMVRTPEVITLTVKKPVTEVIDFYHGLYGKTDGVTAFRNDDPSSPMLSIDATRTRLPFQSITVVHTDMMGVMISVMGRKGGAPAAEDDGDGDGGGGY